MKTNLFKNSLRPANAVLFTTIACSLGRLLHRSPIGKDAGVRPKNATLRWNATSRLGAAALDRLRGQGRLADHGFRHVWDGPLVTLHIREIRGLANQVEGPECFPNVV